MRTWWRHPSGSSRLSWAPVGLLPTHDRPRPLGPRRQVHQLGEQRPGHPLARPCPGGWPRPRPSSRRRRMASRTGSVMSRPTQELDAPLAQGVEEAMCGTRRAGPGQHGHAVSGVLLLRPAASWVRARSSTAIWSAAVLGRALPGAQDGGEALIGVAPGGGDGLRGIMSGGEFAASHVALNRGRRSIVVDLRHEGTALVLARLVQHATSSSSQTVRGSSTPSASVTTPCGADAGMEEAR